MLAEAFGLRVFAKEIPGVFTRGHERKPPAEGIGYRKRGEKCRIEKEGQWVSEAQHIVV
jgi:hypothetical protein